MELLSHGKRKNEASILVAIGLILLLSWGGDFVPRVDAESCKVHIVYLGEKQHDDPDHVAAAHYHMLEHVLGSKGAARDSLIYSYRHGFSGFAAKLTDSQVKKLSEMPGVVHVMPNQFHTLKTTRTWDYLGLSPHQHPKTLLDEAKQGKGIIIGILDSGVWPESEVFSDAEVEPIPTRWKGHCQCGDHFNATTDCNRKIIGAKYFADSLLASVNRSDILDYLSPRDFLGHGTHVSTIAAGSFVSNVSYKGFARATVRGGAPGAHIAMSKVCWNLRSTAQPVFPMADVLKAFDEAVYDGVDLLSISFGPSIPLFSEVDTRDGVSVGAFHAVTKGIPVIASAGNDGPGAETINHVSPWITTVGATTLDRSYPTALMLGNKLKILGQGMYTGEEVGFTPLMYPEGPQDSNEKFSGDCEMLDKNSNATIAGKVVLCFAKASTKISLKTVGAVVESKGGAGMIAARYPDHMLASCGDFPCISVDYDLGTDILFYIRSTSSPVVKISPSRTVFGNPIATKIARFSSRGPSSITPAIMKPDVAAPGANILAATSLDDPTNDNGYALKSGSSMAAPAVSGVVALLKVLHPHWSPAAIRSAIVTTACTMDPFMEPIFAEGFRLANPFDYGGGLVNPKKAAKPGLVYDMGMDDYVFYMCAASYNDTAISRLVGKTIACPHPKPSILDANLPSITIPDLTDPVIVTRTVTNVGPVDSTYRAVINPPLGIKVEVVPEKLMFKSTMKKIPFRVKFSTMHKVDTEYCFGSFTWTDGKHNVTIPLSIRSHTFKHYTEDY